MKIKTPLSVASRFDGPSVSKHCCFLIPNLMFDAININLVNQTIRGLISIPNYEVLHVLSILMCLILIGLGKRIADGQ